MFKNSYKIMFIIILISSTMITISSNSWIGAWMGLEINLLSFIPLLNDKNNILSSDSSMKYFLIQSIASSFFFMFIIYSMMNNFWIMSNLLKMVISSTLMLKMGIAPFHFWFPAIIDGFSWMSTFTLMTWQKIAPFMLMSHTLNWTMMIIIITSAMIGSIGGLNQLSLRKILVYSSINHMSWMLSALMFNMNLWMIYFLIYSLLMLTLSIMFNNFNMSYLNQLMFLSFSNNSYKFFLMINFLSLGGLPPFLGFYPKWIIIQLMLDNSMILTITMMIMFSLITLFFYMRITFSSLMLNSMETKWNMISHNTNYLFFLLTLISMLTLPVTFLLL